MNDPQNEQGGTVVEEWRVQTCCGTHDYPVESWRMQVSREWAIIAVGMPMDEARAKAKQKCLVINCHDDLVGAVTGLLERYTELVNSGDCGNWSPEEEPDVLNARVILAKTKGES